MLISFFCFVILASLFYLLLLSFIIIFSLLIIIIIYLFIITIIHYLLQLFYVSISRASRETSGVGGKDRALTIYIYIYIHIMPGAAVLESIVLEQLLWAV